MSKLAILRPQFDPYRGVGGNLTCFMDSPHMVSYYPQNILWLKMQYLEDNGGGGEEFT